MLPKELVQKLRRLEITTRRAVSESLAGPYSSVFKGRGMAFSEVRLYQPGDEVRTIDWNVSARMQEPYVKVFTEERELSVMLLVDLSRSQDFGTIDKTKGEVAAEVAALLAYSAIRNNDRVGALLFSDEVQRFLPPKKGRRHVFSLMVDLLAEKPRGSGTDLDGALRHLGRVCKRRSIVFLISDFLELPSERALRVVSRRHDLVPVVVSDPFEDAPLPLGLVRMEDPESGASRVIDLRGRRLAEYRAWRAARREERQRLFRRLELDSAEIVCGSDYVQTLARFFRRRVQRRVA